ncbi:VOC family protein [Paenibacillus segetis]|uniref:VOC domain-containing protein n=1 Tax=Paenibacillus segetis TaxID=1325360 RepID=A0ABQ1YJB4_9BACL|nr:VOC family protein [Paenibacillus segetis]GGH27588.1 hypothetical protein GCM10008013_29150 [Paenibacillus segetis]
MKLRVGAVFIPVLNLEQSISWYTDCFGLELVDNWGVGASFKFPSGEALVALIQVREIQPLHFSTGDNQIDNVYFHFETDDLDKMKIHLRENNISIMKHEDHGVMNEIYIIDPSGNQIVIFCEKETSPFYRHATNKISW